MNLTEWLAQPNRKRHTAANLCRLTGLTPPTVSKILHGHLAPSLRIALRMDKGTGGEIKAEKICPDAAELIAYIRGVQT